MSETQFNSKHAIITGAGKGIGRALALALVKRGCIVYAISRSQSDLESLEKECQEIKKNSIVIFACDVTDFSAIEAFFVSKVERVDYLVNNAGTGILTPFLDTTIEEFNKQIAVNVTAALFLSQVAARRMIQQNQSSNSNKGGVIINVSSQAATVALNEHTSYCISKAGLDAMTRNMALELGIHNIRVNSVNPTVILTELGKYAWSEPMKAASALKRICLNRFGELNEAVEPIIFLLTEGAGLITGACIPVDGGWTCN